MWRHTQNKAMSQHKLNSEHFIEFDCDDDDDDWFSWVGFNWDIYYLTTNNVGLYFKFSSLLSKENSFFTHFILAGKKNRKIQSFRHLSRYEISSFKVSSLVFRDNEITSFKGSSHNYQRKIVKNFAWNLVKII